mmetsp:Transcript_109980/g.317976  ORF Transcript_109980/g.317976 Transcript_109980/m.317976 type:complete len:280 (+) Transcript_109980:1824-2663(+)
MVLGIQPLHLKDHVPRILKVSGAPPPKRAPHLRLLAIDYLEGNLPILVWIQVLPQLQRRLCGVTQLGHAVPELVAVDSAVVVPVEVAEPTLQGERMLTSQHALHGDDCVPSRRRLPVLGGVPGTHRMGGRRRQRHVLAPSVAVRRRDLHGARQALVLQPLGFPEAAGWLRPPAADLQLAACVRGGRRQAPCAFNAGHQRLQLLLVGHLPAAGRRPQHEVQHVGAHRGHAGRGSEGASRSPCSAWPGAQPAAGAATERREGLQLPVVGDLGPVKEVPVVR